MRGAWGWDWSRHTQTQKCSHLIHIINVMCICILFQIDWKMSTSSRKLRKSDEKYTTKNNKHWVRLCQRHSNLPPCCSKHAHGNENRRSQLDGRRTCSWNLFTIFTTSWQFCVYVFVCCEQQHQNHSVFMCVCVSPFQPNLMRYSRVYCEILDMAGK